MASDPEHWLFTAGLDSVDQFRDTTRPAIVTWTTSSNSDRGDLAVIYGRAPVKAFVAVARQCSEPVQSRKNPKQWFAYFQVQPVGREVPLDKARERAGLRDWKVLWNLQGRPKRIPVERRRALYRLLAGRDERITRRVEQWSTGRGSYPPSENIDLPYLRRASWEAPPSDGLPEHHERWLADDITDRLVKQRRGRWIEDDDDLSSFSDEYHLRIRGRRTGRADIVLVSAEHVKPTLLLVEVKWWAEPNAARNPVAQVLRYRKALLRDATGSRVKPIVVATEFHPLVLEEARRHRVEALKYNPNSDRLARA